MATSKSAAANNVPLDLSCNKRIADQSQKRVDQSQKRKAQNKSAAHTYRKRQRELNSVLEAEVCVNH